jgi:hypothetical protein
MLPPMSFPPLPVFFGSSTVWMFGSTPPAAMVTVPNSLLSSSSFRTANWMCRGTIRFFLLSLAAFPANSSTCAHKKHHPQQPYHQQTELPSQAHLERTAAESHFHFKQSREGCSRADSTFKEVTKPNIHQQPSKLHRQ